MYAQVTAAVLQPGHVEEGINIFRDSVLPAAREANGFFEAYLFVDREANRGLVVSLWESRADVEALLASGFYQEQVAKVAPLLASPPDRRVYEVVHWPHQALVTILFTDMEGSTDLTPWETSELSRGLPTALSC